MLSRHQQEEIKKRLRQEEQKPLGVAVLGQTGVGKSSLINALFNTRLKIGDVTPVTKKPEPISVSDSQNRELVFWDMPGVGESVQADEEYLDSYRRLILSNDVDIALWGIHADSRSVTFDAQVLQRLASNLQTDQQQSLLSKIVVVLTKADLIHPEPWIIFRDGSKAVFAEAKATAAVLDAKSDYFRDALLKPFSHLITTKTYLDKPLTVTHPQLQIEDRYVTCRGILSHSDMTALISRHPQSKGVFERLYQNTQPVYCSALIRFNLTLLMRVIADRISYAATARFKKFVEADVLSSVTWTQAQKFSNAVVVDAASRSFVFDITKI